MIYEREAWKEANKFKCITLLCNWLAVVLLVVVISMGNYISNQIVVDNVSVYTQALDDWTQLTWNDF